MLGRTSLLAFIIIQFIFSGFTASIYLESDSFYDKLNRIRDQQQIEPLTIDNGLVKKAESAISRYLSKGEIPESKKYTVFSFTFEGEKPDFTSEILNDNSYISRKLKSDEFSSIGVSVTYQPEQNITFGVIYLR